VELDQHQAQVPPRDRQLSAAAASEGFSCRPCVWESVDNHKSRLLAFTQGAGVTVRVALTGVPEYPP